MIVAFTGLLEDSHGNRRIAGAGKDEASKVLVEHGFVSVAFADIMKRFAREVFGFTDSQLWGPSEERALPDKRYYRGLKTYTYPDAPPGAVWIPLAGKKGHALISEEDFGHVIETTWFLAEKEGSTNYVKTSIAGRKQMAMHTYIMGKTPEGMVIDHVNGDGLDNRRENLRFCTQSENRRNQKPRADAESPFKGVARGRHDMGWRAAICRDGNQRQLGTFEREELAAAAYDAEAMKEFGKFARLNRDMFLTPRYALQTLGDWGRECQPDVWANKALEIAKKLLHGEPGGDRGMWTYSYTPQRGLSRQPVEYTKGVVIPDCRFQNEFRRVKEEGGIIIRVKRYVEEFKDQLDDSHISERDILEWGDEKFDHVIENNGTLLELHTKLHEAMGSALPLEVKFNEEQR